MEIVKKSLYQIRVDHLELLAQIEAEDGILTPEMDEALALTDHDFENKAISYGYIIKQFENTSDIIDAEIKRLQGLKKKSEMRVELFKQRLKEAMNQFGVERITTPLLSIFFRPSVAVEIEDEALIPNKFLNKKVVFTPDKKLIKAAIDSGETVIGASLKNNQNLQIK